MARQRSLSTQDDIRRALAKVYRDLDADRLDPVKARVLIYCALTLSTVLRDTALEDRIAALEATADQGGNS